VCKALKVREIRGFAILREIISTNFSTAFVENGWLEMTVKMKGRLRISCRTKKDLIGSFF